MSPSRLSNPTREDNVEVSFYSELMKNYAPELPFDARLKIEAVYQDSIPLIFSVGTDKALYLIFPQDRAETGWLQFNITRGLGEVTAFAVGQDRNGKIRLGIGVKKNSTSRFYMSGLVQVANIDFAKFDPNSFWKQYALPDALAAVNQVRVDSSGALIATTKAGEDARYYTVDELNGCKNYRLPERGSVIHAMALGSIYEERGVFMLYSVGPDKTMLFQGFPDPVYDKTNKYRFNPPGTVNAFALLTDGDGNSQVLTAGKGLYLFSDPDLGSRAIVDPSVNLTFTEIQSTQDGGSITLWLLGADAGQQSGLYYVTNQYYDGATNSFAQKWAAPIRLRQGVAQFACLRGAEISNHLFLISQDKTLIDFFQDESSTLWKSQAVPVRDTGQARELDTYTLHVKFTCADLGKTFYGQKVKVWASAGIYVNLNNVGYQLGPQSYAEVDLSIDGDLMIVNPVQSIKAPIIYVEAPFLNSTLALDMTEKIHARLRSVKTGDDLINAKKHDGSSLLPANMRYDKATLDGVAQGIQTLLDASQNLNSEARVSVSARATTQHVADYTASLQFDAGGRVAYSRDDEARSRAYSLIGVPVEAGLPAAAMLRSAVGFSDFGHAFGDFIHWLGGQFDRVREFIIDVGQDAALFIIRVGENIYRFVLTTAEQVFAAIEWLFQKIYVFFKDIIEWLGFIFNWRDILETKTVLKGFLSSSLDGFGTSVDTIREQFDRWISNVMAVDLNSPEVARDLSTLSGYSLDGWYERGGGEPYNKADPRVHWASSKMHYVAASDPSGGGQNQPGGILAEMLGAIEGLMNAFMIEYDKISRKGYEFISGQCTLEDFARTLFEGLAAVALKVLKTVVDILLEGIDGVIKAVKDGLEAPVSIPLLSKLYEMISGSPLSMMDLTALLLAIPSTIIYKVMFKEAPFASIDKNAFMNFPKHYFASFSIGGDQVARAAAGDLRESLMSVGARDGQVKITQLSHALVGVSKLLRVVTLSSSTYRGVFGAGPGGTPGLLVIDNMLRSFAVLCPVLTEPATTKQAVTICMFTIWSIINYMNWVLQSLTGTPTSWAMSMPSSMRGQMGDKFNLLQVLDAASVTTAGIWGAVLTAEGWDDKTAAVRSNEILTEVFQSPAIVGFFANTIARQSKSVPLIVIAMAVAGVRLQGLAGSSVTEFVLAGQS